MKEQSCIWRICRNPATRADDLVEIANQSRDEFVLADVARNAKTPTELLLKLANHKDAWVRLGVADNPNTPIATRQKILDGFLTLKSRDDNGDEFIARCIFATSESLDDISKRYSSLETESRSRVLSFVATNPNTSSQVLTKLARDRFSEIRIAVASNPKTDANLLRELSK
jgi:DNA-binding NarL/FixJ family response regulator